MVNIVVRQDFGLEFLAKAKPLGSKAKASLLQGQGQGLTSLLFGNLTSMLFLGNAD